MSDLLTSIARTPEDKRQPENEKSFHVAKTVRKSATDVTVKRVAVEKHIAHYCMDSAFCVPATKDCFSVQKYKKSIGKAYNRVNLYLCRNNDYEGIKLSCLFSLGLVLAFTPKFLSSY